MVLQKIPSLLKINLLVFRVSKIKNDIDHTIKKCYEYPMRYLYNILTLEQMRKAMENIEYVNRELIIINSNNNENTDLLDNYYADQKRITENNFNKVGYPAYYDQERNINELLGG